MKKLVLTLAALAAAPCAFADTKLELTANDAMQYSSQALEVTTGEKVTLVFKNIGAIPLPAMGHNVVILKADTPVQAIAIKAMAAKDTDYVPQDADSKALVIAHTKVVGGGQSDTITFTAPAPGVYPFFCSFPGHFGVPTMNGKLTVKAK